MCSPISKSRFTGFPGSTSLIVETVVNTVDETDDCNCDLNLLSTSMLENLLEMVNHFFRGDFQKFEFILSTTINVKCQQIILSSFPAASLRVCFGSMHALSLEGMTGVRSVKESFISFLIQNVL